MNSQSDEAKLKRDDVRFAAWAVGAVLLLVVLAGYLLNPPMTISRLGEVAGVVGFALVVVGMLLMIRLPALADAAGGLESLYGLHRGVGLAAYGLILLHPLLLAQQGGWNALNIEGKGIAFQLGWAALLALMAILASTFLLKMLGYPIWRRIHTLSILAFFAMAAHAASYQTEWPIIGRISFNLVLLVGLLAPVLRYWWVDRGGISTKYRIDQVSHPSKEVIDVHLSPVGRSLDITPGQFVFARFQTDGAYRGCSHFHPFTARRVMNDGALRLSIRANGTCTELMQQIVAGGQADLQGPYGELFQNVRQDSQIWVAGGMGIKSFLNRLRTLDSTHVPVRLFYFFNTINDTAYLDDVERLICNKPNLCFHPVATYGSGDAIESIFDAMLPPWNDKHYLLCGSDGFMELLRVYLMQHGVRSEKIIQERLSA